MAGYAAATADELDAAAWRPTTDCRRARERLAGRTPPRPHRRLAGRAATGTTVVEYQGRPTPRYSVSAMAPAPMITWPRLNRPWLTAAATMLRRTQEQRAPASAEHAGGDAPRRRPARCGRRRRPRWSGAAPAADRRRGRSAGAVGSARCISSRTPPAITTTNAKVAASHRIAHQRAHRVGWRRCAAPGAMQPQHRHQQRDAEQHHRHQGEAEQRLAPHRPAGDEDRRPATRRCGAANQVTSAAHQHGVAERDGDHERGVEAAVAVQPRDPAAVERAGDDQLRRIARTEQSSRMRAAASSCAAGPAARRWRARQAPRADRGPGPSSREIVARRWYTFPVSDAARAAVAAAAGADRRGRRVRPSRADRAGPDLGIHGRGGRRRRAGAGGGDRRSGRRSSSAIW